MRLSPSLPLRYALSQSSATLSLITHSLCALRFQSYLCAMRHIVLISYQSL
uniref:Uncharacterized protein n=1 Tax=Picea glauca TaxID=3330 RepID=A0A117NG38_PICGL|nr:hypothetical protein ABT39_MTgene1998 [Picea glauca]QHR87485.1 hypothetical protein Q903MT_gene1496 [Picea sitchensis]